MQNNSKNLISKVLTVFVLVSFVFTLVIPTPEVFAMIKENVMIENQLKKPVEVIPVLEAVEVITSTTSKKTETEEIKTDSTVLEEVTKPEPSSKLFKKNSSLSVEKQLSMVRKHIMDNNLPKEALERLDQFELEQKSFAQSVLVDEVPSDTVLNKEPFKVETFEGKVQTRDVKEYETDFAPNNIRRPRDVVDQDPDHYLSSGNEIQFSQSIKDQADLLGKDPLKMFNFVRNNIEYVPYFGSKKGADATLVEKVGNDIDKASLLIAMLRYKNIPARYRHANVKMDIRTVTDLLGVETADAAAEILLLNDIPIQLYTLNNEPSFFVIDHVFVEAYIPYGYSRGADMDDGGVLQWVPMDPSINSYYYEQLIDVVDHLNTNGFNVETFFENYLNNQYGTQTPLEAFKTVVTEKLTSYPPTYYPNLTYNDALTKKYPKIQNLEFIPGTLPYEISSNINTYNFIPSLYRHTLKFTVKDKNNVEILDHTAFMSDIADRELLVTYNPAAPADQTIIDSFDTIYDVVPLSLVSVKPVIKVNGQIIATSDTATTLGQKQTYTLEWTIPNGDHIGDPILPKIIETYGKQTLSGSSEAVALNTDRVIPPELRLSQDTQTSSFVSDQILYSTALDYLNRLQYSHDELARIIGGGFANYATKASVFNGIQVTNNNGAPYSFDWKGLRIDSTSYVKYFSRFKSDIQTYRKEFVAIFALQSSQDESDIFENNFDVESVATVKGLKKVSSGDFAGTTMKKITSANESEIDSLQISNSTKTIFHQAIADGRVIYTPTRPVTYGTWNGLFYITIDFDGGKASYEIGEGLNGGYTVEQFDSGWENLFRTYLLPNLNANIISPTNGQEFREGDTINWLVDYTSLFKNWREKIDVKIGRWSKDTLTLRSGYGTNKEVSVKIKRRQQLGELYPGFDDLFYKYGEIHGIPPDLLKSMAFQESCCTYNEQYKQITFDPKAYRYEVHIDYSWYSGPSAEASERVRRHPERHYSVGGMALSGPIIHGDQIPNDYLEWSHHMGGGPLNLSTNQSDGHILASEVKANNPNIRKWTERPNFNFTAQLLLASSYGILQAMYETALTRMVLIGMETKRPANHPNERPADAVPIKNLFDAEFSIKIGADYLKKRYIANGNDWWSALRDYNGAGPSAEDYADAVILKWNNGNGIFKEINK